MELPHLARQYILSRRKVLVLGQEPLTEHIAKELSHEGFEIVYEKDLEHKFPDSSEHDIISKLRSFFLAFIGSSTHENISFWVHPCVSTWSSSLELVQVLQELKINAFLPPAKILAIFKNQLHLLLLAERLKIQHLVLHFDPLYNLSELKKLITEKHWELPLVLKSGKNQLTQGLFVLKDLKDFEVNLPLWLEQLKQQSGETFFFVELFLESSKYISVPFVRFQDGKIIFLPKIDATLQTRFRKLVEFCHMSFLDAILENKLENDTKKILTEIDYVGIGQLDFLTDGVQTFFIGGQAALARNFPLWESVSGYKAVPLQLISLGLSQDNLPTCCSKIKSEVGLCINILAENPVWQLPQPGFIFELPKKREWDFTNGKAIFNSPYENNQEVSFLTNGNIASLFVFAQDRKSALQYAAIVLDEIWISGGLQTNENYLFQLISHSWVQEEIYNTSFVDEEFIPIVYPTGPFLLQHFASVCDFISDGHEENWWVGGIKVKVQKDVLKWKNPPLIFSHKGCKGILGELSLTSDLKVKACAFPIQKEQWQVRIGDRFFLVKKIKQLCESPLPVNDIKYELIAQATGQVHSILFREQATVLPHQALLFLESNQILVPHALPFSGKVLQWLVKRGSHVKQGEILGLVTKFDRKTTKN